MDAPIEAIAVRDQLSETESVWRLARVDALKRAGLSKAIGAYAILQVLVGLPEQRCSLIDVQRLMGVSRSNLTQMANVLEREGLVRRDSRRQSEDHRIIKITLTTAGQRIAEVVQPVEAEVSRAIADCLSEEEQMIFRQYLRRLASSARSLLPDSSPRKRASANGGS
jgi:DNA-binding MarR family transcriptional regulator